MSGGGHVAVLTDADRFPFDERDRARLASSSVELREVDGHETADILNASASADAIFVYHAKLPKEVITRLRGVKILARCGAGYDNIDVLAARDQGIQVTYVPDYGFEDVADHTIALILACARRVVQADRSVRAGEWPSYAQLGPMKRLCGQTLGLLGYGRIGRSVGEKAIALGLRVRAFDPAVPDASDTQEDVLRTADYLSLHLPLTPQTRRAIGRKELELMKPGACLVNTARGDLVDHDALAMALQSGRLASAGIDVFDENPLSHDHPLLAFDNVVLTPHSASFTDEGLSELRMRAIDDVLRVLRGQLPDHPVQ